MTIHQNMFDNSKENTMRGRCLSYSARDFTNHSTVDLISRVTQIWDDHVGEDVTVRDNIILVSLGDWLEQAAWQDETGYHIKFRMHPLYAHLKQTQDRARAVMNAFIDMFPNAKAVYTENVEILDIDVSDIHWSKKEELGLTNTITIAIHTSSHSIGD